MLGVAYLLLGDSSTAREHNFEGWNNDYDSIGSQV
jgi:hypothetical protein